MHDLLTDEQKNLDVRQGPNGIFVPGLTVRDVTEPGMIHEIMKDAKRNRSVSLNDRAIVAEAAAFRSQQPRYGLF